MKLIVTHEPKDEKELIKYSYKLQRISNAYKIIDVKEEYLNAITQKTLALEPAFCIALKGKQENLGDICLKDKKVLVAYIGVKQQSKQVSLYYEIHKKIFEGKENAAKGENLIWVSCYSESEQIDAAEYIQCIKVLVAKAKQLNSLLIIYKHIEVMDKNYVYRSLTAKIINELLENSHAILIHYEQKENGYYYNKISSKKYEPYEDCTIFLQESLKEIIKRAISVMDTARTTKDLEKMYSHSELVEGLYDSLFYRQIPMDEIIYVLLSLKSTASIQFYQNLGLEVINIEGKPLFIYGKKSLLESYREKLKDKIAPEFKVHILTKTKVEKKKISAKKKCELISEKLKYRGEETYIGVIDIQPVDYTQETLRLNNGETRIACIWEQKQGSEGNYYYKKEINKALRSHEPYKVVPLEKKLTDATQLLAIAGGKSEYYTGIADKSEFLVAKINSASQTLQALYAGIPNEESVLLTDILIASIKLMQIAEKDKKPLVLCIPFSSNLSEHEGAGRLESYLSFLATRTGYTFIVPTGEEALTYHHQTLLEQDDLRNEVTLNIKEKGQNVVGFICQKYPCELSVFIKTPEMQKENSVSLDKADITILGETKIYSEGFQTNLLNGSRELLFRIENPEMGAWNLSVESKKPVKNRVDLWLANKTFNPHVTLSPSSALMTAGTLANVKNIISVGGYNAKDKAVQQNSGRGFSWDETVVPTLVASGNEVVVTDTLDQWLEVSGTCVAASIVAGAVATLYSQYKMNNKEVLPTGPMMRYRLLSEILQFDVIDYPNPSQGYGIFELSKLPLLLATPLD